MSYAPYSRLDIDALNDVFIVFFLTREKKMEGMRLLRRLAFYHSDTLQGKLPEVCLCLSQEVF